MRALFYQPSCGIAGDMHIAALIELGVPEQHLRAQLNKLTLSAEFQLKLSPAVKMGISGTHAKVTTEDQDDHRHHSTIVKLITAAEFAPGIEQRALAIFQAIAEAEGKIHNVRPEKVHFHEVGAIDSIVDIVAAAICIEYLNPDIILCNAIEVGSGMVDCAHGRFPVPAPATQELLAQAPCTYGGTEGECTTPTGAAILGVSVNEFLPKGIFRPEKIGYGVGYKDFAIPNVLRVVLGEYQANTSTQSAHSSFSVEDLQLHHYKIEANIDDMNPEGYEPLMEALFSAGAGDVYLTPIIMKKGRPAHCITALSHKDKVESISDTLLNHSTTIGLRIVPFAKRVLSRELKQIKTRYGAVQVKEVIQPNGQRRWKAEYSDVAQIAEAQKLNFQQVNSEVMLDIAASYEDPAI
jgi:uncharacterized protein (TIGR00299 family) protein